VHEPASALAGFVRRAAAAGPDRPALFSPDRMTTWSEFDARVDAVARGLLDLDLPQSMGWPARVAVALPNIEEFAVTLFGAVRAGLVAVPVNPGCPARELRHLLTDSGAGILVGTPEVVANAGPVPHAYTIAPPVADGPPVDEPPGGEDLAVLLYTSGTAGSPKGAMLSHRALIANHAQLAQIEPRVVGPDDTVLLALPLFHSYGLNTGLGAVAHHGARGVLMDRFDPAYALELIARHQVTVVVGVPSMYTAWGLLASQRPGIGEAMASVRVAVCGAAPLDPSTAARFTELTGHPVFAGYGLTETAPVLTSTLASLVPKASSIGRPIPGVELRLADEARWNRSQPALSVGQDEIVIEEGWEPESPDSPGSDPGEIVVRGPNLFSGYWPDGRDGPDADGWWSTGDVAYADADADLFLVDRLAELILVNGFNVYPREVELVLESHPGVAEAAAVGAPHPYTGQTVKAYVVRAASAGPTADELVRYCEGQLARFKCPTAVQFVAELPHSPTGKIRKGALRLRGGGLDG
jgi:long-chain acyl-CoA synthetase